MPTEGTEFRSQYGPLSLLLHARSFGGYFASHAIEGLIGTQIDADSPDIACCGLALNTLESEANLVSWRQQLELRPDLDYVQVPLLRLT